MQKKGMTYERKVRKEVHRLVEEGHLAGDLKYDWWIRFRDRNGLGFAKPDLFLVQESRVLLIECKLTQTGRAWDQLKKLYRPLLEMIYDRNVVCVQACRNLRFIPKNLIDTLDEADRTSTWHCLL